MLAAEGQASEAQLIAGGGWTACLDSMGGRAPWAKRKLKETQLQQQVLYLQNLICQGRLRLRVGGHAGA